MEENKTSFNWKNFGNDISNALQDLYEENDFCDITLACENVQMKAHKVILAACSPIFLGILKRNPHPHPIIYLNGVNYRDLKSILKFVYYGEITVAKEDLGSFLNVAKDLRISGLAKNNSTVKPAPVASAPPSRSTGDPADQPSSKRLCPSFNNNLSNENSNIGNGLDQRPFPHLDQRRDMTATEIKKVATDLPEKGSTFGGKNSSEFISNERPQPSFSECVEPNGEERPDISNIQPEEDVGLTEDEIQQRDMKAAFHKRYPSNVNEDSLHSDYNGESCTLASSWTDSRSSKRGSDNHDTGTEKDFVEQASEFIEKNGTTFVCSLCKKTFPTSIAVHRHVRNVRCDKCGRAFRSLCTLGRHTTDNLRNKICETNEMLNMLTFFLKSLQSQMCIEHSGGPVFLSQYSGGFGMLVQ